MKKAKKIFSLLLVIVLTFVTAVGMTVAYFIDTDEAVNEFTVGNIAIELIEEQRPVDEDTKQPIADTELEDFKDDKQFFPIVGSAQGEKDSNGLPVAGNYVDKVVTVKNTGDNDAYVRVFVAVPHNLDDGADTYNAAANVLHFNFGNVQKDGEWVDTAHDIWNWKNAEGEWNTFEYEIDDVLYTVYVVERVEALPAGETSERVINGFYLDKDVDVDVTENEAGEKVYTWTKGNKIVEFPLEDGVKVPVFVQAIQVEGFETAADAFAELPANPWA